MDLMPLVTRVEYSCRTLHNQGGPVSENTPSETVKKWVVYLLELGVVRLACFFTFETLQSRENPPARIFLVLAGIVCLLVERLKPLCRRPWGIRQCRFPVPCHRRQPFPLFSFPTKEATFCSWECQCNFCSISLAVLSLLSPLTYAFPRILLIGNPANRDNPSP
jgi:hypothetical protein